MKGEVIQLTSREQIDLDLELTSYVSGTMTPQDKLAFEARLVNDKHLQQKLADEIEFKNQWVSNQPKPPSFNLEFKDLDAKLKPKPSRRYPLIAASLFAVFGISYFMLPSTLSNWGTNSGPNITVNEFETLTSEGAGMVITKHTYTLVLKATISADEREQLLNHWQLVEVSENALQGLQQNRITVAATQVMSKKQLETIRNHHQVLFFESNNDAEER